MELILFKFCSYPEHCLTLRRNLPNHVKEKKSNHTVEIHDSDDDEYEDATETFTVDDEMFVDNLTSKRIEPLSKISLFHFYRFRFYQRRTQNFEEGVAINLLLLLSSFIIFNH